MKVDDLIPETNELQEELIILKERCSQFIEDSNGLPVFKNLPTNCGDFQRVKVRTKHGEDGFTETFNEAFETELPGLRQRAIFANGEISFEPAENGNLEPFYIFPINGHDFMYCSEIENSSFEHKQTFDVLFEHFGEKKGREIITELLRFAYTSDNLNEGIESGAEIIFYGTPFYYAIRSSVVEDYQQLLSSIHEVE